MADHGPQPYVVSGEWRDPEWVELASDPRRVLTFDETRKLIAGPRLHPFGPEAVTVMRDGAVLIYPNREAAGE